MELQQLLINTLQIINSLNSNICSEKITNQGFTDTITTIDSTYYKITSLVFVSYHYYFVY